MTAGAVVVGPTLRGGPCHVTECRGYISAALIDSDEWAMKPTDTAAEVLYRRGASVRAIQGGDVNPFSRALDILRHVADELPTPVAVVGGLAAIHHGVIVTTLDVDVVVGLGQDEPFLARAEAWGLTIKRRSPGGWHQLVYHDNEGDVEIQLIPAGQRSPRDPPHAPPIPTPQQLGVEHGLGYASFAGWVAMKLVANRDKDRYHVAEALRRASAGQIAAAVQWLRELDRCYLTEFERLLRAAEDENADTW
jgi:hypothetical protein